MMLVIPLGVVPSIMIRLLIGSRSYDLADPATAGDICDRPVIPAVVVVVVVAAPVAVVVVVCCGSTPLPWN